MLQHYNAADGFLGVNKNYNNDGGKIMNKFENLFLHIDVIDQCDKSISEDMCIGDLVSILENTGRVDVKLYGPLDVSEITANVSKLVVRLQGITGFEYGIVVRNVVWNKVEIDSRLSVKHIDYVLNASVYE